MRAHAASAWPRRAPLVPGHTRRPPRGSLGARRFRGDGASEPLLPGAAARQPDRLKGAQLGLSAFGRGAPHVCYGDVLGGGGPRVFYARAADAGGAALLAGLGASWPGWARPRPADGAAAERRGRGQLAAASGGGAAGAWLSDGPAARPSAVPPARPRPLLLLLRGLLVAAAVGLCGALLVAVSRGRVAALLCCYLGLALSSARRCRRQQPAAPARHPELLPAMQHSSSRAAPVRYRRRQEESESDEQRPDADPDADTEEELEAALAARAAAAAAAAAADPPAERAGALERVTAACASAAGGLASRPGLAAGVAAGVAAAAAAAALLAARRRGAPRAAASAPGGAKAKATPGPNARLRPSKACAPLADGSAVVALRPIAADNSCLFNAVGYCMHHATNRAPFLRQVVSREVSSDPQVYSDAFLGMSNAAYCAWITNPAHWGGGIELAILAAHYRREIAAWNLETGACHVFGEEKGYAKRVMVMYTGTHYDALAVAAGPRAPPDDDVTEFNPRTRRGRAITAAAAALVKLHRKGRPTHQEQQKQQQQQQKAAAAEAAAAAAAAAGAAAPGAGPAGAAAAEHAAAALACNDCGERVQGVDAARAHAAATGHAAFSEVAAA
ncbi:OTU2 [Scenedesmus sp. PABB004]|nr:OTU2 [Scenedesmus sp. PABB004]